MCSTCGGYLKTIDLPQLSPFPLLSISDIETTDLDVSAMDPLRFGRRYASRAALQAACEGVYRNYYSMRGGRV